MRRLPRGALGLGVGVVLSVVVAVGVGVASGADEDAPEDATWEQAPDSNFPDPQIAVLDSPLDVVGTSLSLTPPNVELKAAAVDGAAAVETAELEFGPSAKPDRVTATLAWDEEGKRLVWAISFTGICVPALGRYNDPCTSNEWIAIVDATTGKFEGMVSFRDV